MIKTLTIVENKIEGADPEYQLSGDLSIDDAAKALVMVAFNAGRNQAMEQSKKDSTVVPEVVVPEVVPNPE